MIRKKSKFWTFVFSWLPGTGHMYMGFMRQGISLMALFFGLIVLAAWSEFYPIIFAIPIVWFYSFFDAMNKASLPNDEFYSLEDDYVFSLERIFKDKKNLVNKQKFIIAIAFILIGINLLGRNIMNLFYAFFPYQWVDAVYYLLSRITTSLVQVTFSIMVIYIGVKLISGKKKELEDHASINPEFEKKTEYTNFNTCGTEYNTSNESENQFSTTPFDRMNETYYKESEVVYVPDVEELTFDFKKEEVVFDFKKEEEDSIDSFFRQNSIK